MDEKIENMFGFIDGLIDEAHEAYFECESEKEKAMLDGKIKAYWEVCRYMSNVFETEERHILNTLMQ